MQNNVKTGQLGLGVREPGCPFGEVGERVRIESWGIELGESRVEPVGEENEGEACGFK